MNKNSKIKLRSLRKLRAKIIKGTKDVPRIVVNESNRFITVQAIDDDVGNTLIFLSTKEEEKLEKENHFSKKNIFYTKIIAEKLASRLREIKISEVLLDRNGRLYQGKLKIFFETLKQNLKKE